MANKMTPMAVAVFLVALIFLGTTAQATYECLGVVTSIITSCENPFSTQCCEALNKVAFDGDVCRCLQELRHYPLMASSKAEQFPGTCNLPVYSPILKCFDPISSPLPPLTGILPPIARPSPPPTPAAAIPAAPLAAPAPAS